MVLKKKNSFTVCLEIEISSLNVRPGRKKDGVFTVDVSGNFFSVTRAAIIAFQKKYGIPPIGLVGPLTKAKLLEIAKK